MMQKRKGLKIYRINFLILREAVRWRTGLQGYLERNWDHLCCLRDLLDSENKNKRKNVLLKL